MSVWYVKDRGGEEGEVICMLAYIAVDITGNVNWMWLGCVIGLNVWFQCPLDIL